MLQAVAKANAAVMERTPFAIDDAQDSSDEEDDEDDDDEEDDDDDDGDESGANEDDQVLDEVDAFLEAHDSGLTEADKEVAKREFSYFS